jgi:4-amino-4-deoxy-L-arabinose transferase-like glycosyltransferase
MKKLFSWEVALPLGLFAVLFAHGARIGLTDDEAYYWALAQRPAWAYAYHPPMVAWLIWASQQGFGWFLGTHSPAVVRLPSAALIAATLALAMRWLRGAGVGAGRLLGSSGVLLSLAGIFALSWMMVPDLPLIFGWMLAFLGCFNLIQRDRLDHQNALMLGAGVAIAILSKYSGVLVAGSAGLSFLLLSRNARTRWGGCLIVILAAVLAAAPLLIWNAHHQWASILYQIRDRHEGASISFSRYLRFWLIEAFAAGPALLLFSALGFSRKKPVLVYAWIWAAPALLIYCTQPLWADFKPHWALIGWWPIMLALAWSYGRGEWARLARIQRAYGLTLVFFVLLACHVPIGNWILSAAHPGGFDPRLDVTNDLVGWDLLAPYLRSLPGNERLEIPVVASRYQTAGQASFSLGPDASVTLLPRDIKEHDEWPDLDVLDERGALKKPILFVTDIRYDAQPELSGADCVALRRLEFFRGGSLAKWVGVWRCTPRL